MYVCTYIYSHTYAIYTCMYVHIYGKERIYVEHMQDVALTFCHICATQVCAYAILDIVSKVGLSFMIMSAHDALSSGGTESQEFV